MKERRRAIVDYVNAMGNVSIAQLKEAFPEVSEMTIRNDIKALDHDRQLVRVYGGVRSMEFAVGADGPFDLRRARHVEAKGDIARKAAGLVRANTTLYLDSGSTVAALAGALPDLNLTVFTCGVYNLLELGRLERVETIVPGGALNRINMCLHGSRTVRAVRNLRFDQMFIGASSYMAGDGFGCGSDEEAELKRTCIERSEQRIVLMDASKIGRAATFTFCDLADIDIVVTDGDAPDDFLARCAAAGVEVL